MAKTCVMYTDPGNYAFEFANVTLVNPNDFTEGFTLNRAGTTFNKIDSLIFRDVAASSEYREYKFNNVFGNRGQAGVKESIIPGMKKPQGASITEGTRVWTSYTGTYWPDDDWEKGMFMWYDLKNHKYGCAELATYKNGSIVSGHNQVRGTFKLANKVMNATGTYIIPIDYYDLTYTGLFDNLIPQERFPGPDSDTGGSGGNFDDSSDSVDTPVLPNLSASNAGFISLYSPSIVEMKQLADYMWSDSFDVATFKKLLSNPMDVIIGASILPVQVPTSGAESVKLGIIDSGIKMQKVSDQYVEFNCGTLSVKEYWGSALDYSPYTKISIFLPYIGTRELKTDDIMNKDITVIYHIDTLSGGCTAMIKCGDSILYQYSGCCACSLPLTNRDWSSAVTATIQLAAAGIGIAAGAAGSAAGATDFGGLTAVQSAHLVSASAGSVMSAKPNVNRSGAVSGAAGFMGVQKPYIIIERPRQSLATNYNAYVGYPCNITSKLGDLTGYTEVESIHLDGFNATDAELEEIYNLLKGGVIL